MTRRQVTYERCLSLLSSEAASEGRYRFDRRATIRQVSDTGVALYYYAIPLLVIEQNSVLLEAKAASVTPAVQTRINWVLDGIGYQMRRRRSDNKLVVIELATGNVTPYASGLYLTHSEGKRNDGPESERVPPQHTD